VSRSRIPPELLAEYVHRKRVEWNRRFEPLLTAPNSEHPSGVVGCSVVAADALRCAQHLQRQWREGSLPLGSGQKAFGWTTYGTTIVPHDAEQQRLNTLLLTNVMLPAVRKHLVRARASTPRRGDQGEATHRNRAACPLTIYGSRRLPADHIYGSRRLPADHIYMDRASPPQPGFTAMETTLTKWLNEVPHALRMTI